MSVRGWNDKLTRENFHGYAIRLPDAARESLKRVKRSGMHIGDYIGQAVVERLVADGFLEAGDVFTDTSEIKELA